MDAVSSWSVRLFLSIWAGVIAYRDWREGIVPNELVLPVLMVALVWRLGASLVHWCSGTYSCGTWFHIALAYSVILTLFRARMLGGGSAKFLLSLVTMFPTLRFFGLLAAVTFLGCLLLSADRWAERCDFVRRCWRERRPPTDEELDEYGDRVEWLYAMAALIYLWEMW